jgi:glucose/arabinose dehydrogenase
MKSTLLWVSASLLGAIATVAPMLIATGTRGETTSFPSSAGQLDVRTVAAGLDHPWSLAFLGNDRMLVTERPGRLRVLTTDGKMSAPVRGVPAVWALGQGGLLDVVTDRNFTQSRLLYLCFAERSGNGGRTAVARGRLSNDASQLDDVNVIFRQEGPLSSGNHYGCRIAQGADDNLFVGLGDHFTYRDEAQNLANHLGKVIRIAPDGSVPNDNPFISGEARPEIWSYGHRNIQATAINPATGALWEIEHGPRGGDEVNIAAKGKNYGWPVIGYGIDYSGAKIHEATSKDGMEQPLKYWVPSIAPSGMAFYTADMFSAWKGSLFLGALSGQALVRLTLDGDRVANEERLLTNLNERIRDVRQGPDGALYLLTDSSAGRVLRVAPVGK